MAGLLTFLMLTSAGYSHLWAKTSDTAREALSKLLLGKQVKALVELPATKNGIDIYFKPPKGTRTDERGLDLAAMSKWLKARGVGIDANEPDIITDVRVGNDRVEIHIGGGGEGRRGGKHAQKVSPGYKRAGGSRVNFRYQGDISDADIEPKAFLSFMERILDVSQIRLAMTAQELPEDMQAAISAKTVKEGMTYQMVLMSFGEPDQKKINDTKDESFSETWSSMKEGHRWVLDLVNGKVAKVRVF